MTAIMTKKLAFLSWLVFGQPKTPKRDWNQEVTGLLSCHPRVLQKNLGRRGWVSPQGQITLPEGLSRKKTDDVVIIIGRALELDLIKPDQVLYGLMRHCENGKTGFDRPRFRRLVNVVVECSPRYGVGISIASVAMGINHTPRRAFKPRLN